jgi:hypothetical protein
LKVDLTEKKLSVLRVVQAQQLPFLEVVVEVDQKKGHEKVKEALEAPQCCLRVTVKQRKMCD